MLFFGFSFLLSSPIISAFNFTNSSITGVVVDASSKKPLPNANVLLFDLSQMDAIDADASDTLGIFSFENVRIGTYRIVITYIGYNKFIIDSLTVKDSIANINLGELPLDEFQIVLEAAVVTGERQTFEFKHDILNVNVDKLKSSDSETITEILRKVPFIYVQGNDKIFLNGLSTPTILLDGRKSSLTSVDLLTQTNVSNIERIEILLSSSAKYEAEGSAGVINIITKKSFIDQFKVNSNITAGNKNNYRVSLDLNYGVDNLNFYGGYKNNYTFYDGGSTSFTNYFITDLLRRTSISNFDSKNNSNNFRLGFDYLFNKNTTISTLAVYDSRTGIYDTYALNSFIEKSNSSALNEYRENNSNRSNRKIFEYLLNYTYNSEEFGHKFKADFFYSNVKADNNSLIQSFYFYTDSTFFDNRIEKNKTGFYSISADYEYEPERDVNFQVGIKSIFRERYSDFLYSYSVNQSNVWLSRDNMSNDFKFKDQIHAAYGIYSSSLGNLGYTFGMRGEYVRFSGDQLTSHILFSDDYFDIFPSIKLRYDFGNRNIISLNYSRDLNRPYLANYNPFVMQNSSYSFTSGNPKIKPSYTDKINIMKMIHLFETPTTMVINFARTQGAIGQPMKLKSDGTSSSTAENNENLRTVGFYINSNFDLIKEVTISPSIIYSKNFYEMKTYNGEAPEILKFTNDYYIIRFNIWGKIFWDMNAFLDLSCISGFNTSVSKRSDTYIGDFTIKKSFFEKSLDISINLSNFIQRYERYEYSYTDYYSLRLSKPSDMRVSISFAYNFNNFKTQRSRKPHEDTGSNE